MSPGNSPKSSELSWKQICSAEESPEPAGWYQLFELGTEPETIAQGIALFTPMERMNANSYGPTEYRDIPNPCRVELKEAAANKLHSGLENTCPS